MTTAIVDRLKTGTISNVVPFGTSVLPPVPYVVVKPEAGPSETRWIRIIAHYAVDYQIYIEDYVIDELSTLLSNWTGTDRNGNLFRVFPTDEWSDIISNNDDNSISMERVFVVPQRMY